MDTMRVAVTGSSGLIGEALVASLEADGHRVHRVTRSTRSAGPDDVVWDPMGGRVDTSRLEGTDAVVHLAGEPIGDRRWSDEVKRAIHDSRSVGTRTLAEALAGLRQPPRVLVSGSAVGYYGDRGDEVLTETSSPGHDFMARVTVDWEVAATPAADAGIRVVHPRTGVVMAEHGPLIEKVRLPFKLGVGGKVGNGRQYVSWIALEDEVRALRFLIDREISGPVNLTAPEPVTNAEFTSALGDVMHRPTVMPIPVLAIKALYGEMGTSLATVSQRVIPQVLEDAGFEFRHRTIRSALEVALGDAAA
ncbi:MAG: TIGR01777 family oxidoreductase [Nitriliruptor sp.]